MDESTCQCTQQSFGFSGSLAPLDEELSVHFRGPINLKQFGVYYPSSSSLKKRDTVDDASQCAEGDVIVSQAKHKHKRNVAVEYVEVTATVFVDENGNTIDVPETPATSTDAQTTQQAPSSAVSSYTKVSKILSSVTSQAEVESPTTSTTNVKSTTSSSSSSTTTSAPTGGAWARSAYYTPGSADNCVFMNNKGGTAGSGIWSSCFGNSISFAASDGINGASSPQALNDVTLLSNNEFMIFSGSECSNGDCGYTRDGIPAYHGFAGASKIFVFEFSMPSDNSGSGFNQDMPAVWLLNAKIPRTLQYGQADCSCWSTGCGEFDLFEILSAGSDKLITHIHDGQGGGTQDYFQRPTSGTLKAAVVFNGDDKTIHIVEVEEDFTETLSEETVQAWLNKAGSSAALP